MADRIFHYSHVKRPAIVICGVHIKNKIFGLNRNVQTYWKHLKYIYLKTMLIDDDSSGLNKITSGKNLVFK